MPEDAEVEVVEPGRELLKCLTRLHFVTISDM